MERTAAGETASTTAPSGRAGVSSARRVAVATIIGTTVEWYDYFIYATAAGLVFSEAFFKPAGADFAAILSFATVGISFLFRPLGAFLAGHFGDLIGRRAMLVITLILMGLATTLIGLLPTYATIGVMAPVLLLILRILQGISAGGEWGGAVLMAVEHAPADRRGRAGSFPQLGVPLGMLIASGVMALMTGVISPGKAFLEWGWRVPFLLSVLLIVIGYLVRRSVDESPVFKEIAQRKQRVRMPIVELFRRYWAIVLLAALIFAGNSVAGYMTTGGFIQSYTTGKLGMNPTSVLIAVSVGAFFWFVTTYFAGFLADKIGRKRTYIIGFICQALVLFPVFWLINLGSLPGLYAALALFSVGLGFTYGPQAAWYAEIFPASVRFSGVSISYALGAILGGAFAPTIAQSLLQSTGGTNAIVIYLLIATLIALGAVLLLRDRPGIPLGPDHQAEQESGATVFRPSNASIDTAAASTD